ncbi:MAG: TVP38/TMEM64 family protein [Oscillospiraceae bacterium]|nr:TVP38/TMEM64 family protein [Oscillospiraceae bacterium]
MKTVKTDKNRIYALGALIAFLTVMAALSAAFTEPVVAFVADAPALRRWVQHKGIGGRVVFVGLLVVQMIIAFIPGEPFEIAAGYAFGWFEGTLLCLIGSLIGAVVVFTAVRIAGIKLLYMFFTREDIDRVSMLNNHKRFNSLVFAIFLVPGTPKDIMSYFVGLSKMQLGQWLFISTIAKIPSIITSTVGGSLVGDANYTIATVVFVITAIISIMGMYFYNNVTDNASH